jgi:hypothetical protein
MDHKAWPIQAFFSFAARYAGCQDKPPKTSGRIIAADHLTSPARKARPLALAFVVSITAPAGRLENPHR